MPHRPPIHRPPGYKPPAERKALHDRTRGSAAQRGYGWQWTKLRKLVLAEQPICKMPGCWEPSAEVDHIVPKAKGGTDDRDNLQGLCKPCHSRKTASEDGGFGRR